MAKKTGPPPKHDYAELAAHEDSRRRRRGEKEKQEVVARQLGVDPRRLRDAWHRALHDDGDPAPFLAVLDGRLDDYAYADDVARKRVHLALATDPTLTRGEFVQLQQRYRDEERRARGLKTDEQLLPVLHRLFDDRERAQLLARIIVLLAYRERSIRRE